MHLRTSMPSLWYKNSASYLRSYKNALGALAMAEAIARTFSFSRTMPIKPRDLLRVAVIAAVVEMMECIKAKTVSKDFKHALDLVEKVILLLADEEKSEWAGSLRNEVTYILDTNSDEAAELFAALVDFSKSGELSINPNEVHVNIKSYNRKACLGDFYLAYKSFHIKHTVRLALCILLVMLFQVLLEKYGLQLPQPPASLPKSLQLSVSGSTSSRDESATSDDDGNHAVAKAQRDLDMKDVD